MEHLIFPACIAGLLTFLAPCTLPLVPAYIAFISGTSFEAGSEVPSKARLRVFMLGVFFVLGFSAVFILLGVFAGSLGRLLEGRAWVARAGGVLVMLLGLVNMGILSFSQLQMAHALGMRTPDHGRGSLWFSFVMGVVFASGWTPCIGPVLGSVLVLASTSATALSGAFLLGVFSLGLAVPFLLVALGVQKAHSIIESSAIWLAYAAKISGALLVILGVLLLLDKLYILAPMGYRMLDWVGYGRLMQYF